MPVYSYLAEYPTYVYLSSNKFDCQNVEIKLPCLRVFVCFLCLCYLDKTTNVLVYKVQLTYKMNSESIRMNKTHTQADLCSL